MELRIIITGNEQANVFHYGSISLIEEPCKSTHIKAMQVAKESGGVLSFDPNLRLALWPSEDAARDTIMSVWSQADIIKVCFYADYINDNIFLY